MRTVPVSPARVVPVQRLAGHEKVILSCLAVMLVVLVLVVMVMAVPAASLTSVTSVTSAKVSSVRGLTSGGVGTSAWRRQEGLGSPGRRAQVLHGEPWLVPLAWPAGVMTFDLTTSVAVALAGRASRRHDAVDVVGVPVPVLVDAGAGVVLAVVPAVPAVAVVHRPSRVVEVVLVEVGKVVELVEKRPGP